MRSDPRQMPNGVPVLSRGKHRNPRRGACFMEMASFLAGEKWSDHPKCTHPLLAELARMVNDNSSDAARQRLAPLIPDVIGLNGTDIRIDAELSLHCLTSALPVASAERQRVLAVGILATERLLAPLDGRSSTDLRPSSRAALESVPDAWAWANLFSRGISVTHRGFRLHSAPRVVSRSVEGIATACVPDAEDRLYDMLRGGIESVSALVLRDSVEAAAQATPDATPHVAQRPHQDVRSA